jgi:hypothetical protein
MKLTLWRHDLQPPLKTSKKIIIIFQLPYSIFARSSMHKYEGQDIICFLAHQNSKPYNLYNSLC